ncbi:MAG: GIY-YIG nuclease family protein [Oscillospiraceae bacterium]|nr:GIY-YIG nuclease family protein [Oscillospiraceae bacterium]
MFIYILRCGDDSLYTGIAADIQKRIKQHRGELSGGAKYTRSRGVKKLEALWHTDDSTAARKMEYAIKKLSRADKEKLISAPELITEKYIPSLAEYDYRVAEKEELILKTDLTGTAAFGVAGNFTGHLEQAGEASDFKNMKVEDASAPKAIFPTYIPGAKEGVPEFLSVFPFDPETILYPADQKKLQIEPECAVIFEAEWEGTTLKSLKAVAFGASNDCSIRREGAQKISLKKNWGRCSKGFSAHAIPLSSFDENSVINDYRIASFLVRDGKVYPYGEDSAVKDYSYIYGRLMNWMLDKFNNQQDEGPAENINAYLNAAGRPERILVSIGATRYTEFGETNFLTYGDHSVVVLYPASAYSSDEIEKMVLENDLEKEDISYLDQVVCE